MDAYNTDVRPLLADLRESQGLDADPVTAYRKSGYAEKIVTERKQFFLDLKENARGRVVKITEDVRGRRDTIMVPVETLQEFYDAIGRILEHERGL